MPIETIATSFEGDGLQARNPVFGVVSNFSETGACIITNVGLATGASIRLTLTSRRYPKPVTLTARVVWSDERIEPVKEIVGFSTGVSFTDESAETVRSLISSGMFHLVP